MSGINPALTAEEWAATSGEADWSTIAGIWLGLHVSDEATRRDAIAALALHGQPFGFTWDDVDLLLCANVESLPDADALFALVDRIAALLPPRET